MLDETYNQLGSVFIINYDEDNDVYGINPDISNPEMMSTEWTKNITWPKTSYYGIYYAATKDCYQEYSWDFLYKQKDKVKITKDGKILYYIKSGFIKEYVLNDMPTEEYPCHHNCFI